MYVTDTHIYFPFQALVFNNITFYKERGWRKKNGKPLKNIDIWIKIAAALSERPDRCVCVCVLCVCACACVYACVRFVCVCMCTRKLLITQTFNFGCVLLGLSSSRDNPNIEEIQRQREHNFVTCCLHVQVKNHTLSSVNFHISLTVTKGVCQHHL